jgi:hypothetical protein
MIVVFKLDPDTYRKIRHFVEKGSYESVENFVQIAVANQIQLENQGISSISAQKKISAAYEIEKTEPKFRRLEHHVESAGFIDLLSVPKTETPILQPLPATDEVKRAPIWGQVNRLAPAKFVLRMLANHVALSGSDRVDLKRFAAEVAENATLARLYIEKKDKTQRIRGEELYVAFPKKDPKSQQRFINFYVGKIPSGRWTDGVLTGLSFARIEETEDGSISIGLTEAGAQFMQLYSPLIDDFLLKGHQIKNPFSAEEVEFLLKHTKLFRPGDLEYLISVLQSVKDGADTPTVLRQKILEILRNKNFISNVSEKVVNTMQVGAIGRLVEMRLLRIEKDAQKSTYLITDSGNVLLSREVKQ